MALSKCAATSLADCFAENGLVLTEFVNSERKREVFLEIFSAPQGPIKTRFWKEKITAGFPTVRSVTRKTENVFIGGKCFEKNFSLSFTVYKFCSYRTIFSKTIGKASCSTLTQSHCSISWLKSHENMQN